MAATELSNYAVVPGRKRRGVLAYCSTDGERYPVRAVGPPLLTGRPPFLRLGFTPIPFPK